MSSVAMPMADDADLYCRYSVAKIDSELINLAHAASRLRGKTFQEWLSDVVNDAAAKELGRKPIKRKPPKPRTPRKEAD